MKRRIFFLPLLASVFFLLTPAFAQNSSAGIVNFTTCITESKFGVQEQEAFDEVKNKMSTMIADLEGQLREIAEKFEDPEFVDSLSPEAEQEHHGRFRALQEEHGRYQNQFYQVMNQANMKLIQLMSQYVSQAAESVAKKQKLSVVLNKEACFYYEPKQDITAAVIAEMDKSYEKQAKSQTATAAAQQPSDKARN